MKDAIDNIYKINQYPDNFIKALQDSNIASVVYYPVPLHFQEAFNYLGYKAGDFPESESAAENVLSLPIYPELEPEKAKMIAEIILNAL